MSLSLLAVRPLLAQCPDGSLPPCGQALAVRAVPPAPTSVAVLPLENRSPDPADAYFAEGMTEEIGNRLTQVGRLQVKARGLVAAQWRRTPDAFEAARRLNVAWFVSGNVRHAGAQLVVNVELVRATTGEEVWASRFPRPAADVFAVQAEVAESVAVVVGGGGRTQAAGGRCGSTHSTPTLTTIARICTAPMMAWWMGRLRRRCFGARSPLTRTCATAGVSSR